SYVRAATAAGYATLNLDRLGHGQSSRVAGDVLDLNIGAFALHQVIQKLRSGFHSHEFGHVEAERVLIAGESLGGNLAWLEAATYQDVEGLVVAGSTHVFGPGLDFLLQITVPVEQDPFLKFRGFPPGYMTTVPGTRGEAYYYLPQAEPAVVFLDEVLKQ